MKKCLECKLPLDKKHLKFCCDAHRRAYKNREMYISTCSEPLRYCANPACGKQLTKWKKVCCSLECREAIKKNKPSYQAVKKPVEYLVRCKCPVCGDIHTKIWSCEAKIMPRVYCDSHEHKRYDSMMFDNVGY